MADRLYIPSGYVDEICPPGRASPTDWIGAPAGDVWLLATEKGCDFGLTLAPGQLFGFYWVRRLGDIRVEIRDDGTYAALDPVPEGTNTFAFGTEVVADTLDAFVEQWRDAEMEIDDDRIVVIDVSEWSHDEERFQFDVGKDGRPRFIRAAPGARAQQ